MCDSPNFSGKEINRLISSESIVRITTAVVLVSPQRSRVKITCISAGGAEILKRDLQRNQQRNSHP